MSESGPLLRTGLAPNRRQAVSGAIALALSSALAARASATEAAAEQLITKVIGLINGLLGSGRSEEELARDLESVLAEFAASGIIARTALGPPWRRASDEQRDGFSSAFRRYLAKKYLRRLPLFGEGRYEIVESRRVKERTFEVVSYSHFKGRDPFSLRWHVVRLENEMLIFNLVINGVNMLAVEQSLIRDMYGRRNGDLDLLIADLAEMG